MRNMIEYPLVAHEVMSALERAYEDRQAQQYIGDTGSMSLHAVIELMKHRPALLQDAANLANALTIGVIQQ